MEKSLNRHINIAKLLRTPEQTDFLDNHTLIHGIYDDYGLEGMIVCKDWDTPEGLKKINSSLHNQSLRCRFNGHRSAKSFIKWMSNDMLEQVQKYIEDEDFVSAKAIIIRFGLPI